MLDRAPDGDRLLGRPTPASASRRTSSRSSSRPSSRPTAPPAASTAAPASASRSAARSPRLLGGEIRLASAPGQGQHLHPLPAAATTWPRGPRSGPRRVEQASRCPGAAQCLARSPVRGSRSGSPSRPSPWRRAVGRRPGGRSTTTSDPSSSGDRACSWWSTDDPGPSRASCSTWRSEQGLQGARLHARRTAALALARELTARRHHARPATCRTWTAGRCSTGSSTTRDPRTSPCTSSPSAEDRERALKQGALGHPRKPPRTRRPPSRRSQELTRLRGPQGRRACSSSRTTRSTARTHHRADRQRRRADGGGGHRRGGAGRASPRSTSTAWCSTWGCPTCPASSCSASRHTEPAAPICPIIVYTGRDLIARRGDGSSRGWPRPSSSRTRRSPERLLDETGLFLHRAPRSLPEPKRRMLEKARHSRIRCSRAARCWSWTTTCATSSP